MKTNVALKPCRSQGRREDFAPESDLPEDGQRAAAEANKADRARRNGRALSVWAAVLVGLPFVLPVVFYINGALTNHALPIGVYLYLVLVFVFCSVVGGFLLYLDSRAAGYLRKWVGWTTLATALFPITAAILFQDYLLRFDGMNLNRPVSVFVFIALLLTLLCMILLCVFTALLLRRVFSKQPKLEPEG